jgi:hypothetical protein
MNGWRCYLNFLSILHVSLLVEQMQICKCRSQTFREKVKQEDQRVIAPVITHFSYMSCTAFCSITAAWGELCQLSQYGLRGMRLDCGRFQSENENHSSNGF